MMIIASHTAKVAYGGGGVHVNIANVIVAPMRIRDTIKIAKLRKTLHVYAPSSENSRLQNFALGICFILSCNSTLRWIIHRISPHLSFVTLVAKENNNVLGIAWLQPRKQRGSYFASIVIFPQYQSHNIGTLLDERREEMARDLGAKQLEVITPANNYKNLGLAKKQGYTATKVHLTKEL